MSPVIVNPNTSVGPDREPRDGSERDRGPTSPKQLSRAIEQEKLIDSPRTCQETTVLMSGYVDCRLRQQVAGRCLEQCALNLSDLAA